MDPGAPLWHATWSTRGRLPVAPDEAARRALVREIVARAGTALVLFCVVDDHVHVVLLCDREALSRVVRALGYTLRSRCVEAPHVRAVGRRAHMEHLVTYLLTQTVHHGLAAHPATWSGSAAPDLLGARDVGWLPRLWDVVPRLRLRDVHLALGLPAVRLEPADDDALRAAGPAALAAACSAAFGADPALEGRAPEVTRAITAAAKLAREVGVPLAHLAEAAGRARETVSRAADRDVPDRDLRTLRLRVALDHVVATAPRAEASRPTASSVT